jgi:hypothetical protein
MTHSPRRHGRTDLQLQAMLIHAGARLSCRIVNISAGGAKLRLDGEARLPDRVGLTLEIPPFGAFAATPVWQAGENLGIQFDGEPAAMAEVLMGLAVYSGQRQV